ncbi:MAG: septum formation family protein [Pseudonocardiaceae bacterium]
MSDLTADLSHRRRSLSTRRIAGGAVLGALLALLLAITVGGGGDGSGPGLFVDDPQDPDDAVTTSTSAPFEAAAGTCLTWTTADASDAERADCGTAHLFEATGTVDLARAFTRTASFPADDMWRTLVSERCTPLTTEFLGGRFDPFGRFSVGAIKPSAASWRDGDRDLRCGLQTVGRSGALFATTGSAANQDQSDVHEPGTCLGNDSVGVGDPVDCAQPHAVEVVGVVDLGPRFPEEYPDEEAQDTLLSEECMRLADEFAGGPEVVGEKGLTVFWETLRGESWDAGSHRVDCRLGAFLPDRSGFAPVTGGVRGDVVVGTEPAPPLSPQQGPVPTTVTPMPAPPPPPPMDPAPPG